MTPPGPVPNKEPGAPGGFLLAQAHRARAPFVANCGRLSTES